MKANRTEIAALSTSGLAKYKDAKGRRLHPKAIGKEIQRRVKAHKATHPKIRAHAAKRASRVLK